VDSGADIALAADLTADIDVTFVIESTYVVVISVIKLCASVIVALTFSHFHK